MGMKSPRLGLYIGLYSLHPFSPILFQLPPITSDLTDESCGRPQSKETFYLCHSCIPYSQIYRAFTKFKATWGCAYVGIIVLVVSGGVWGIEQYCDPALGTLSTDSTPHQHAEKCQKYQWSMVLKSKNIWYSLL